METGQIILNPRLEDIPSDFGINKVYGFDTETFGLGVKDRAFSFQLSDGTYTLYWNLKKYDDAPWLKVVSENQVRQCLEPYLKAAQRIFIANAKFDIIRLHQIELNPLEYNIYCNHALHRLIDGNADSCSLEAQGEYWGYPKDKTVEEYIKKHGLYTRKYAFGFEIGKDLHYDRVPFHIIQPYACRDAWLSYTIGCKQIEYLKKSKVSVDLIKNELALTKVLYKMELRGIKLDLAHVENMIKCHIEGRTQAIEVLGVGFTDGKTYLVPVFNRHKLPIIYDKETKEPVFKSTILEKYEHIPEIQAVLKYRYHHKLLKSFYLKLWTMHVDGVIHTDFNQYAAKTGRMASRSPSIMNIPSRAGKEVKQCFIPFEGKQFLCVDHSQAELRLAYDISNQMNMVERFKNNEDMHTTLSNMVKVDRFVAKTTIFALIYGSGIRGISNLIKMPYENTKDVVFRIKKGLPKVWLLEKKLKNNLKIYGYVRNLRGRVIRLSKKLNYKIFNYFIQGSLADIVKEELVKCDKYLENKTEFSFPSLTVHDSIIFQIDERDASLQRDLVDIMESVYVSNNGLKLLCDVEKGENNYGETKKGYCFEGSEVCKSG